MRADALLGVRASVERAARSLQPYHVAGGGASSCRAGAVLSGPPWPFGADPRYFSGPIHLSARGAAVLACEVHAWLVSMCAKPLSRGSVCYSGQPPAPAPLCAALLSDLRAPALSNAQLDLLEEQTFTNATRTANASTFLLRASTRWYSSAR